MIFFGLKGEARPESYQFSMFNMAKTKSRHRITFKYSARHWKMERLYSKFSFNAMLADMMRVKLFLENPAD